MSARRLGPVVRLLLALAWGGAVYVFLLAPLVVVAGASLNGGPFLAYVNFPPDRISLDWYLAIPGSHLRAIGLSLGLALVVAAAACLLGVPAALGLIRGRMPGKALLAALLREPLQIPFVVIGVAFLQLYYVVGDAVGLYLQASFTGLALAHVFAATPYVIGSVGAVLQRFDVRLEEAALSLGASRWSAFRRVTLPVIMPGVYTGGLYAFMLSFTDVPIVLFLAGAGFTTFPVEVFHSFQFDFNPTILASSTLVMLFSLGVLLVIQKVVGLNTLLRSGVVGGR
jgi:putative spermidine/putrescine transport system permease protein